MKKDPFLFKYIDGSVCFYCDVPTKRILGHMEIPTPDACYCPKCGAYVTMLASDQDALGSVAGPTLRGLRWSVHQKVTPVWKSLLEQYPHVRMSHIRFTVYDTVGMLVDVPETFRYVAMFREEHCRKALALNYVMVRDMSFLSIRI